MKMLWWCIWFDQIVVFFLLFLSKILTDTVKDIQSKIVIFVLLQVVSLQPNVYKLSVLFTFYV